MNIFFITWVLCGLFSAAVFLKDTAEIDDEIVLLDIIVALLIILSGYIAMVMSLVVITKGVVIWRKK